MKQSKKRTELIAKFWNWIDVNDNPTADINAAMAIMTDKQLEQYVDERVGEIGECPACGTALQDDVCQNEECDS